MGFCGLDGVAVTGRAATGGAAGAVSHGRAVAANVSHARMRLCGAFLAAALLAPAWCEAAAPAAPGPPCQAQSLGRWRVADVQYDTVFAMSETQERKMRTWSLDVRPGVVRFGPWLCHITGYQDAADDLPRGFSHAINYDCAGQGEVPGLLFSRNCSRMAAWFDGVSFVMKRGPVQRRRPRP